MERFHAHIYFPPESVDLAQTLANDARRSSVFDCVEVYERPVGPHPTGMIEIHFTDASRDHAMNWLESHRGDLSVLVHRDTGDDFQDHTHGIVWLGSELLIDFGFFQLIQERPDLRVHPESA